MIITDFSCPIAFWIENQSRAIKNGGGGREAQRRQWQMQRTVALGPVFHCNTRNSPPYGDSCFPHCFFIIIYNFKCTWGNGNKKAQHIFVFVFVLTFSRETKTKTCYNQTSNATLKSRNEQQVFPPSRAVGPFCRISKTNESKKEKEHTEF